MKQHFTDNDFIYGQSSSNANERTFAKRKDHYQFEKLSSRYSLAKMKDFMIATFLETPRLWVYDLLKPEAEHRYTQWRGRLESLTYRFTEDCEGIFGWLESKNMKFNDLFVSTDGKQPIIVKMAVERLIDFETLVIFDKMFGFMQRAADGVTGDEWARLHKMVKKYSYFVDCDLPKLKAALKKKLDTDYPDLR